MLTRNLREEINNLHANICSGLADPNRILILYTLSERPYSVSELAEVLNLPQPTTSRHLKILRERNMVVSHREGQSSLYSLSDRRIIQALDVLRGFMADNLKNQVALVDRIGKSQP